MSRDITQTQFDAACKRHGFKPRGVMGYYLMPDGSSSASVWNAGPTRREQLAYLIQQWNKIQAREQVRP